MMKTMRYILLWMVLANSMVLFARTDAKDDSGAIDRKRMAAFKEYVVNYTLLQNLPLYVERNSCDGAAIIMHNLVKENVFVYTDTEEHDVPCRLLLQLNKKGMITDCTVEGLHDKKLVERIKKNHSGLSAEIA